MHELSLCRSIETIVLRAAGGRRVGIIEIDVGDLRQVVPSTLEYCWGLVVAETALAGSRLEVNHIPAVLECEDCEHKTTLDDLPIMKCESCGSQNVRVVSGEEFMVAAIQLES
ncbi:MAG: hydrogenase maturation nickel metallochaperone HypA [Propionibacteriaceae bacterium]|nr:hydrogenase maturation nickel metallochaperone HypA [Propionibacteriaceae bacterium]